MCFHHHLHFSLLSSSSSLCTEDISVCLHTRERERGLAAWRNMNGAHKRGWKTSMLSSEKCKEISIFLASLFFHMWLSGSIKQTSQLLRGFGGAWPMTQLTSGVLHWPKMRWLEKLWNLAKWETLRELCSEKRKCKNYFYGFVSVYTECWLCCGTAQELSKNSKEEETRGKE